MTSDLSVITKDEDSTVLYAKGNWGHSIGMPYGAEKVIVEHGYVAMCMDVSKTENGPASAIGIIRKFADPQMFRGKINSLDFKAAEASVVTALSKQHLCDYRL